MHKFQQVVRDNYWLGLLVFSVAGVLLHYGYLLAQRLLVPLFMAIGKGLLDPSSSSESWPLVAMNISFILASAFLATAVILAVLNYLARPSAIQPSLIAVVVFLLLSNWWFITDSSVIVQREEPQYLFLKLLWPVVVVAFYWLGIMWLVKRNTANNRLVRTPGTTRHVS